MRQNATPNPFRCRSQHKRTCKHTPRHAHHSLRSKVKQAPAQRALHAVLQGQEEHPSTAPVLLARTARALRQRTRHHRRGCRTPLVPRLRQGSLLLPLNRLVPLVEAIAKHLVSRKPTPTSPTASPAHPPTHPPLGAPSPAQQQGSRLPHKTPSGSRLGGMTAKRPPHASPPSPNWHNLDNTNSMRPPRAHRTPKVPHEPVDVCPHYKRPSTHAANIASNPNLLTP